MTDTESEETAGAAENGETADSCPNCGQLKSDDYRWGVCEDCHEEITEGELAQSDTVQPQTPERGDGMPVGSPPPEML